MIEVSSLPERRTYFTGKIILLFLTIGCLAFWRHDHQLMWIFMAISMISGGILSYYFFEKKFFSIGSSIAGSVVFTLFLQYAIADAMNINQQDIPWLFFSILYTITSTLGFAVLLVDVYQENR